MPSVIATLRKHIHVICMLKDHPKWLYEYNGKKLRLANLYCKLKKKRGKTKIKASVLVKSSNGKQARIIFVPSDNERGGLALLFPTMQIDKKIYKVFGVVTNIKEMNGEDLIHWLHERCGKSEEAHAVMKEDLAGGTAIRNAVLTSSITALSLF